MKKLFILSTLTLALSLTQSAVAEISSLKSLVYANPNASPDRNAGINGQAATTYVSSIVNTNSAHVIGVPTNTANILLIREYLNNLPQEIMSEISNSASGLAYNTNFKLEQFDKKLDKSIAMQSALTGLFQPYNVGKFNLTAAVGGYKSQNAVAVGTGYRFTNNVAAKMGVSFIKGNSAAYNAGLNLEW